MRARDMIDALDRVSLFRAQALNSHRRLDDIGGDLDGAISLLDLQQQQSPDNEAGAATGVTQGIHRAVLDWSTGIIAKLAGAIPPRSETKTGSLAVVAPGDTRSGKSNVNDRHARNSRRWLLDPRIWEAFVRSLEGAAVATEPTTHVPLAAGVPVLRAAVLAVREAESGGRVDQGKVEDEDDDGSAMEAVASAGDWAFTAIRKLCGSDDSAGKGLPIAKSVAPDALSSHTVGEGQGGVLDLDETGVGERGCWKRGRPRGRGALMRVTLDACTIFVEEVIHGRRGWTTVDLGGYRGGKAANGTTTSTDATRSEEVLTELLRFLGVLMVQQTNRRKVFASFCSKLMGPLFEMLSETRSGSLKAAATALAWDALFHEEHLEGYREAFIATAAAGEVKGGDKAKRRRTKKNRDGEGEHVSSASGATAGGGRSSQRRACYQQQLLEEISKMASSGEERSRLGAAVGAPLLLEGFIVGLKGAGRESTDIHMPSGGGSANASAVVVGGKRSRSAASTSQLGGTASMPASPASQMFKLWAVLTSTLGGGTPIPLVEEEKNTGTLSVSSHEQEDKDRPSHSREPAPLLPAIFPVRGCCNHYLRACNEMLRLLVVHDVYRVNEDRGGLELDRLRAFSTKILELADAQPREPGADENTPPGTVEGFVVRIFRSLLRLNHGILHDDLSRVLRMTLEWGFTTAEADAARESEKVGTRTWTAAVVPESIDGARVLHGVGSNSRRMSTSGGSCDGGVKEGVEGDDLNLGVLRALCVDLVIGIVDTYSRLRQMDHLVRALFGAVDARPSAAAAMLRREGSVEDALGRAFRQLPEGQIESMWCVLAEHLRESWKRLRHNSVDAAADADAASLTSPKAEATVGAPATGYPLAREIDAELFVLFVRNLHVTSSVASVVGELCENLAEESLRCFEGSIQESRATAAAQCAPVAPSSPSPKKAKKKKRRQQQQEEEEEREKAEQHGRSGLGLATPLPFRPALEVHGWLLDLDTRCRFWSQILGSSSSGTLAPPAENTPSVTSPSATLPRMITAAAAAAASAAHGDHSRAATATTTATTRLKKTLQQVAVHRVQQIYARLNGAAALEANSGGRRGGDDRGEEQDGRLEKEARQLVDFAFAMVASDRPRGCPMVSMDTQANAAAAACDGDREDKREGPSLSAMMPYVPVWVGFAAVEQVSTFVEAIFLRCAADLLAGKREEESAPLRLLTDASFYEMEAIAEIAPSVLLRVVRDAVDLAVTFANGADKGTGSEAAREVIQALASQRSKRRQLLSKPGGGVSDDGNPPEYRGSSGIIMSSSSSNRGSKGNCGDGGGGETAVCDQLREATCLLLLVEQFPPGFLEDDAVDGLLMTADALGSTCVRVLSSLRRRPCSARIEKDKGGRRIKNGEGATDAVSALNETVAALRGLLLHLLLLRPESSVISPGDLLLRAIDSAVETVTTNGGVRVVPLQLRSSTALLPLLAERCATEGRTEAVLEAIVRLGVSRDGNFTWGHDGGHRRPQPLLNPIPKPCCWCSEDGESDEEGEKTLFLFHGVLSGFVAGETRRLAAEDTIATSTAAARAAENKASLDAEPNVEGEYKDEDDNGLTLVAPHDLATQELKSQPSLQPSAPRLNCERLFAPVSHLACCLPAEEVAPAPRRGLASAAAAPQSSTPLLSSSHLFVLGDALRLSFLGAESERLVFSPRVSGSLARTRSQWVQDAALYLRRRAEAAVAAGEKARGGRRRNIETRVGVFYGSGSVPGDDGNAGDNNRDEVGTCACAYGTLSERSACCQLLRVVCGCSQLLDPPLPRSAIRDITEAFLMFIVANRGGVGDDRRDREKESKKQEISLLLEAAFCLLVQRASEEQLDEVFVTLLEAMRVEEEGGGRLRISATCRACAAVVAITLARLAAQAGGGENFRAVVSNRATSLIASLCRSLRRVAVVTDPRGGTGHNSRREANCACTRMDEKPKSAAEALDGLESLMSRGRGASTTARVVSVVLGSMEPAVRAVLDTAEALRFGGGKEGSQGLRVEIARCFRACCRVLETLLQVHARKIFSCTPPFAALCRSLLRLFFCLAAPQPRATAGAHPTSTLLPLGEQLSAASALARVLGQFLPNGDVLRRYAAVVLLEYVSLAGSSALEPAPRAALLAGVFAVMEACTRREMRQLHGLLTASSSIGQEVFRSLNEEYQRRHKYTGNI